MADQVQVVEDEHDRPPKRGQRLTEPGNARRLSGTAWAEQPLEYLGRKRLDTVNRHCDVA